MKYAIVNRPDVYDDIFEATQYYLKISKELANKFLLQLEEAEKYISVSPYSVDVMYKNIRMHLVKNFPYHIHFIINEEQKQIIVLAIVFSKKGNLDFSERT